jgi:hypothetical protein
MDLDKAEQILNDWNYFKMDTSDFWREVDIYACREEMAELEEAENIYLAHNSKN